MGAKSSAKIAPRYQRVFRYKIYAKIVKMQKLYSRYRWKTEGSRAIWSFCRNASQGTRTCWWSWVRRRPVGTRWTWRSSQRRSRWRRRDSSCRARKLPSACLTTRYLKNIKDGFIFTILKAPKAHNLTIMRFQGV